MSEKLENALRGLQQSVENFEKNFAASENRRPQRAPSKLDQNDLFGLSQDPSQPQNGNAKEMAKVLDRTINRMEKLVGENA